MAGDISKSYLTPAEIKAGFKVENDGKSVNLYNNKWGRGILQQWLPSVPNLESPIRRWFSDYYQARNRLTTVLTNNIADELHDQTKYAGQAVTARNNHIESLAKLYEYLSEQEHDHYEKLHKIYEKMQRGDL